jgi:hypothetical protein
MVKRSTYEDDLQITVAQYLDLQGWLWCHIPNGGVRNKREAAKLKQMGVKAGMPDVMIFERWTEEYHNGEDTFHGFGIAIELKSPKDKLTNEQEEKLDELDRRGWLTAVCRTINEVTTVCEAVRGAGR